MMIRNDTWIMKEFGKLEEKLGEKIDSLGENCEIR